MTRTILASFIMLLCSSPGARTQSPAPPDSLYDILDSVLTPTRDGSAISAIVVTKKGEGGPRPVTDNGGFFGAIADAGAPLRIMWLSEGRLKIPVSRDTGAFVPTTIFIVRHAEKASQPAGDPPLLEAGARRASDLARLLGNAGIRAIYASQYLRTRQTAEPLSRQSGIPVTVVPVSMSPKDPREISRESIDELVGRIRRNPGENALIVGHSNTVPEIIRALGGDIVPVIGDADYDNLYIVTTVGRGTAKVARLSF